MTFCNDDDDNGCWIQNIGVSFLSLQLQEKGDDNNIFRRRCYQRYSVEEGVGVAGSISLKQRRQDKEQPETNLQPHTQEKHATTALPIGNQKRPPPPLFVLWAAVWHLNLWRTWILSTLKKVLQRKIKRARKRSNSAYGSNSRSSIWKSIRIGFYN